MIEHTPGEGHTHKSLPPPGEDRTYDPQDTPVQPADATHRPEEGEIREFYELLPDLSDGTCLLNVVAIWPGSS